MQIRFASLHRFGTKNIISRAPFGHTPNDTGSGLQPLLAAYMPPLRILPEGAAAPSDFPRSCSQAAQSQRKMNPEGAVRLRILAIQAKLRGFAPEGFQRDRSLPPPVADKGRWSVGIAKEQLAATIAIPGLTGKPFGGALGQSPKLEKANYS